jgi:hypothetical protein
VISGPSDLRPGTLGDINWDADKKTAIIKVLDASARGTGSDDALPDMEFTIVHELIHLELAYLPRTDDSRSAEEFAVNRLTEALLHMERRDLVIQSNR